MTQPQQQQDPRVAQIAQAALGAAAITQHTGAATTAVIQVLWRQINPYDKQEVSNFATQAGRIIVSSQRTVANAHAAAQQLQLRAVGINQPVTVTIPGNVRGASVDFSGKTPKVSAPKQTTVEYKESPTSNAAGVEDTVDTVHKETVSHKESEPDKLFERAAEKYRYERSVGKDHPEANDMAEQKIVDQVDTNLLLSARLAQQQTLKLVQDKDARLIGYRRLVHPELSKGGVCGMCVAAADRVYKVEELRPIHARCQCTISPVTTEHDPGFTLNQDDLDRLYEHAAEAAPGVRATSDAALKRTRYKIHHHHEYGPVLTRVTGEPLSYFRTDAAA